MRLKASGEVRSGAERFFPPPFLALKQNFACQKFRVRQNENGFNTMVGNMTQTSANRE
jgi:hypothetical protein